MTEKIKKRLGKYWYIKERHNPNIGIYYIPMGRLTKAQAEKHISPLFGMNTMLRYKTDEEYRKALAEYGIEGKTVKTT